MKPRNRVLAAGLLCALAIVCILPAVASAERTIGLLTPSVRYELDPGESVSGEVVAINDGDEAVTAYVYPASQRFDTHGAVDYFAPAGGGVLRGESATWIELEVPGAQTQQGGVPAVRLDPGERLPVHYTIKVPEDASPGDHSIIIFFEMRQDASDPNAAKVGGRIGARIKVRTTGDIVRRLVIDPFEVPECIIGNKVDYHFILGNTGNVDASTTVSMEVIGRHDELVGSAVITSQTVAYARSVIESQGKMTLPKGALGFFTLRLVADTDWGDAAPGETTRERAVFAIPIWLLVALGVLAVLIQLRIWWNVNERKRRRKTAERRQRRAAARALQEGTAPPLDEPESDSA